MLQIVFSYDTLVESNQLFNDSDIQNNNDNNNNNNNNNVNNNSINNSYDDNDDSDNSDEEDEYDDHYHRKGSSIERKNNKNNEKKVNSHDDIIGKYNGEDKIKEINNSKKNFLNGFYGSAAEIFGLNEEISNVAKSFEIQRHIDQMNENEQKKRGGGKAWKRRVGPNQGYIIPCLMADSFIHFSYFLSLFLSFLHYFFMSFILFYYTFIHSFIYLFIHLFI